MKLQKFVERFEANQKTIVTLVSAIPGDQIGWRPKPKAWSILEVLNHLVDEEREDFRCRLDYLLHRPGEAWPGIDPEGWVIERDYNSRDVTDSIDAFRRERTHSIEWLRGLEAVNWELIYQHPPLGPLRAGDLLASWLTHDYLHLRQLLSLQYAYLQTLTVPFSSEYAGGW